MNPRTIISYHYKLRRNGRRTRSGCANERQRVPLHNHTCRKQRCATTCCWALGWFIGDGTAAITYKSLLETELTCNLNPWGAFRCGWVGVRVVFAYKTNAFLTFSFWWPISFGGVLEVPRADDPHLRITPYFSIGFTTFSEIMCLWLQPQACHFRNVHWSLLILILFSLIFRNVHWSLLILILFWYNLKIFKKTQ